MGRESAEFYETLITKLCGLPPGAARDTCVGMLLERFFALYTEHGITPPAGLTEYAARVRTIADGSFPRQEQTDI